MILLGALAVIGVIVALFISAKKRSVEVVSLAPPEQEAEGPAVPRRLADLLDAPLRTPHLSIARVRKNGDVNAVVDRIEPLLPLRVRLDTLALTVRDPSGWTTLLEVPLG